MLPPELAAGVSVERFRREIQLAAQLQHPHIVPLLTAGEADGLPYFTMPFVEGESLRARLAARRRAARRARRSGSCATSRRAGLRPRRAWCTATSSPTTCCSPTAHAVVTDFGVAKALSASTRQRTAHVARRRRSARRPTWRRSRPPPIPDIDHRADIYAFGVLAYEMLTGQTPFHGRSPHAMLGAQLAATSRSGDLPRGPASRRCWRIMVMQCLEKRPADRPQTASDLIATLDMLTTPSGGGAAPAVPSGAVETV